LYNKELPSPRGLIKLDEKTNYTFSPSHLISCNGNFNITIENTVTDFEEEKKKFVEVKVDELHSSWRNTYLCS
jgi:hypothetical protein